jgi:hypothetical protein
MKRIIMGWALSLFLIREQGVRADLFNPNTDWFSQAKYGIFIHFLPSGKDGLKKVEQFDAGALASQLEELGAGYFIVTLGQNSGYFNSPNAAYEERTGYQPGERCSTRDLPLDLARALQAKGIRLMLYLPCQVPNEDARAQKAFGLPQGAKDQPIDTAFAERWCEVIQEWSDRYGDKVAGWWFDGGYEHIGFNDAIADRYAATTVDTLQVGFKWIGQAIDLTGPEHFAFGCEESHGYLAGTHVRDKDASVAALLGTGRLPLPPPRGSVTVDSSATTGGRSEVMGGVEVSSSTGRDGGFARAGGGSASGLEPGSSKLVRMASRLA